MTKVILFLSLSVVSTPAWAGLNLGCAANLSLEQLPATQARFKADIARLAQTFSDLKIELQSPEALEAAGGLPLIAKPTSSDSAYFKVVIHAKSNDPDGPHVIDFAQGFNVVPKFIEKDGQPDLQFELEASVETEPARPAAQRKTRQHLELMGLFVALSATPYAHFLRITQRIDPTDHQATALTLKSFRAIRESKMQGLTDRLTVRLHWPWLVETLGENGFPIHYNAPKILAYREVKNRVETCLPDKAQALLIEYEFLILDTALLH